MSLPDCSMRRLKLLATLGNVVEWYDFGVFGYLSVPLATAFFPYGDATAQLAAVYATFGVGFLMRPVGAVVFGRLGDTVGRLRSLSVTITLMGLASVAIACLPTYAHIGAAASIALTALRLLQGACVGGEYGGSVAALYEESPEPARAKSASLSATTTILGILLGSVAAAGAQTLFGQAALENWGWRALFLIGGVAAIGIGIARAVPAARPQPRAAVPAAPWSIRALWRQRWTLARMTGAMGLQSVAFYLIFVALPSVAADRVSALWINSLAMAWLVLASHFFGRLTERVEPMRLHFRGALLYVAVVFFLVGRPFPSLLLFAFAQLALATLHASIVAPTPGVLASAFPRNMRHTGVASAYNWGVALFGGGAPVALVKLRALDGQINWAAVLIAAAGAVTLLSLAAEGRARVNEPSSRHRH